MHLPSHYIQLIKQLPKERRYENVYCFLDGKYEFNYCSVNS